MILCMHTAARGVLFLACVLGAACSSANDVARVDATPVRVTIAATSTTLAKGEHATVTAHMVERAVDQGASKRRCVNVSRQKTP